MANTRRLYLRLWPAIVLLLVVQLALAMKYGVLQGHFIDPDSYTWMNRATLLHDSGNWFDSTNPRIDPPYGHDNHWSRPFDLLLLVGAWIGSPVFGFTKALHGAGVLVNLFLYVLALFAVVWAFSPFLREQETDVLGLLFISQMGILVSYYVGRPDHQSLLNLLFIISVGLVGRLLRDGYHWTLGLKTGLVSALGIWVSVEFILVVLAIQSCLGMFWLFGKERFSERSYHYSATLLLFAAVALFLEVGPEKLLVPWLDQISIAFLCLFALIALFWLVVYRLERGHVGPRIWYQRLVVAALAGGVILVAMNLFFPGFFGGPDPHVDKLYWKTRIVNIQEGKALIDLARLSSDNWTGVISRAVFWLGIAIPGIPVLVSRLVRTKNGERRLWAFVAIGLVIYLPLVFEHIRWVPYAVTLLVPLYAIFVGRLLNLAVLAPARWVAPLRIVVVVLCSVGLLFPALAENRNSPASAQAACPLTSITPYLSDPHGLGNRPRNLLAFVDFGPELLYRTPHSVYSYPNHRWQPGYTDSYHIFTATADKQARALIRKRKVDLILICPGGAAARVFARADGRESFYQRLARGEIPPWLEDVSPPPGVADSFRLYKVRTP